MIFHTFVNQNVIYILRGIFFLINLNYSKEQILERYLNEAPVGGNLVGIASATEIYFEKEVSELTPPEGATIAALINAPSRLSCLIKELFTPCLFK